MPPARGRTSPAAELAPEPRRRERRVAMSLSVLAAASLAFIAVAAQVVRLALVGQDSGPGLHMTQPVVATFTRPDIIDRNGRLIATDLSAYSLFADPQAVLDADEAAEDVGRIFPDIDQRALRAQLADKSKRFVWIKRGLSPELAQRVHNLGLPGLAFRNEPKRSYPLGRLAGHLLGTVSIDNNGLSGIERHIDQSMGLEPDLSGQAITPPVVLTIDIGVQHGLEEELATAMARYTARGAAGVLMDVNSGEVLAGASMPDVNPADASEGQESERIDRLQVATYELGSIFKMVTVAMVFDYNLATPDTVIDVRQPLRVGPHVIRDPHPAGRPLSVRDVFVRSSNVGAGRLALSAGVERQQEFLQRLGLTTALEWDAGVTTAPRLPKRWGKAELITISYGHGIALAPLQFAVAAASLVNGGFAVAPSLIRAAPGAKPANNRLRRVIRSETSAKVRELMRRNVIDAHGTGRRAAVDGFDVGGKTGTAERAAAGGYKEHAVVSSFVAVFPISKPRYLLMVTLVEPKPAAGTKGHITAGVNAAPVAGAIIERIGRLLPLYRRGH